MGTRRIVAAYVALLATLMMTGCAHHEAVTTSPGVAQTQQQIQGDPNLPDAVKRVRMQSSSQLSGPPIHHPSATGQ